MSSTSTTTNLVPDRNRRIREFVLKYYLKGWKAKEIGDKLNQDLQETVCRATVERWMMKFRAGKYQITDQPKTGRRARIQPQTIRKMIEEDPLLSATEICCIHGLGRTTVTTIITGLQLINVNKMWVPRKPSQELLNARMTSCRSLLNRHTQDPFLDRVIFEGERVIYYNVNKKEQANNNDTLDRPGVHELIFQIWWDRGGPIFYKFNDQRRLTKDNYIEEIKTLIEELKSKRSKQPLERFIIHHNTIDHLSPENNQFIQELGWEQIYHTKSSPDLSPTNYCLFQYLQYYLQKEVLSTSEQVQDVVNQFFVSRKSIKNNDFYKNSIDELPERWLKVLDRKGLYIETNEKK